VRRKRAVFYNALGYAVELGLLDSNPIDRIQWKAPEVAQAVDRRVVATPTQVAALLDGQDLRRTVIRRESYPGSNPGPATSSEIGP
jgi:hypothetical protein